MSAAANAVAATPTLLPALEGWVIVHAQDLVSVQKRLQEFDATLTPPQDHTSLAYRAWCKSRAERLLLFVKPTLPVRIAFHRAGLLPWRYLWTALIRVDRAMGWGPPVAIILFAILGLGQLLPGSWSSSEWFSSIGLPKAERFEHVMLMYQRWRILKPNETAADARRSVRFFKEGLDGEIPPHDGPGATSGAGSKKRAGDGAAAGATAAKDLNGSGAPNGVTAVGRLYSKAVSELLQQPQLSVQHAEDLVRAIFAGRLDRSDVDRSCEALYLLPPALRSPNADVRALINATLIDSAGFLWNADAKSLQQHIGIGPDAKPVAIERSVYEWWAYLAENCGGKPRVAGPVQTPAPPTIPALESTTAPANPIDIPAVTFAFGSARLLPGALSQLQNAADELGNRRADITGYTDSIGARAFNIELSLARARAVRDFFVGERQLDRTHFSTFGRGPDEPIASNGTRDGRAKNRRVVVAVLSDGVDREM